MNELQKRVWKRALVIFLGGFTLYILTLAHNLSHYIDGALHLSSVVNDARPNSHHIAFYHLSHLWGGILELFGITSPVIQMGTLSALFGALSLVLFFLILKKRVGLSLNLATFATMLPLFSYGFWFHSIAVSVYIISFFFVLLSFYLISNPEAEIGTWALGGVSLALGALIHQVHGLFVIVAISIAILDLKRHGFALFIKRLTAYGLPCGFIVAFVYFLVITQIYEIYTVKQALSFLAGYAQRDSMWQSLSFGTFILALVGIGRAFIGMSQKFAIPSVVDWLTEKYPSNFLMDEELLVSQMSAEMAIALTVFSVIVVLVILALFVIGFFSSHQLWKNQSSFIFMLLSWLVTYSIFFLFWCPMQFWFWIPQTVVIWVLFCIVFLSGKEAHWKKLALFCVIAGLFVSNFFGNIKFLQSWENDFYYTWADDVLQQAEEDDFIVADSGYLLNNVKAFSKIKHSSAVDNVDISSNKILRKNAKNAVFTKIENTLNAGKRTVITSKIYDENHQKVYDQDIEKARIQFFGELKSKYQNKWKKINSSIASIYVLERNTPRTKAQ